MKKERNYERKIQRAACNFPDMWQFLNTDKRQYGDNSGKNTEISPLPEKTYRLLGRNAGKSRQVGKNEVKNLKKKNQKSRSKESEKNMSYAFLRSEKYREQKKQETQKKKFKRCGYFRPRTKKGIRETAGKKG